MNPFFSPWERWGYFIVLSVPEQNNNSSVVTYCTFRKCFWDFLESSYSSIRGSFVTLAPLFSIFAVLIWAYMLKWQYRCNFKYIKCSVSSSSVCLTFLVPSLKFSYVFFIGIYLHSLPQFISAIFLKYPPLVSPFLPQVSSSLLVSSFLWMTFALINLPVFPLRILFVYYFQWPEISEWWTVESGSVQTADSRLVAAVCCLKWLLTDILLIKACPQTLNHHWEKKKKKKI